MILDGGSTPVGIESTVLSLAGGRLMLLRPGMISKEEIETVVGNVAEVAGEAAAGLRMPAPGMHRKHYSPRTKLVLIAPASGRSAGEARW